MERKEIDEAGLIGDLYFKDGGQRYLAIILLGGSEGGRVWPESVIEDVVEQGYAVFALAYFGIEGLPRSLESIPLEYFERAMFWLGNQPEVVPNHYAVVGGSKGGELGLLLGSRYPDIKTVVGAMPSSVVFMGIRKGFSLSRSRSSWSYLGRDIPFVEIGLSLSLIKAIRTYQFLGVYTKALKNKKAVEKATIPVENINGPILLMSGKHDQMWPSTYMSNQIVERLERHNFRHRYEHIALETGHNVFEGPGAWENIMEFLRENFKEMRASTIELPLAGRRENENSNCG